LTKKLNYSAWRAASWGFYTRWVTIWSSYW